MLAPRIDRMARRLTRRADVDWRDVASEGWVAALSASRRFAAGKNWAADAGWLPFVLRRAKGAMLDTMRRSMWPRGARRFRHALAEAEARLAEDGRAVTTDALAAVLGWTPTQVQRRSEVVRAHLQRSAVPLDILEVETRGGPAATADVERGWNDALDSTRVSRSVRRLPARDREIVTRYYWRGETLQAIGRVLGIGATRVRQLHARALTQLRRDVMEAA